MSAIGQSSLSSSVELLSPPETSLAEPAHHTGMRTGHIPRPATVHGQILWLYALPMALFHLAALAVFIPYFFSWTGLVLLAVTVPLYGLGITLVYHRLLAHRSLKVPKWFE